MGKMIGGAALALCSAVLLKLYGDYKYHCGVCDSDEFWQEIVHTQGDTIKVLCDKLRKKEDA